MNVPKDIVERKIRILNGLSGNDGKTRQLRYNMYRRYGNIAEALYKDPVVEGLIRGNPNTFGVLTNKTVWVWVYNNKNKYGEFAEAAAKCPELTKLFSNIQEFQKGIEKVKSIVKKDYDNITFEEFLKSLEEFNPNSIIPLEDSMEDIEIDDSGYYDDSEEYEEYEEGSDGTKVTGVYKDSIDPAFIDRQIKEAEEDLARGDLEPEAAKAVQMLIAELKTLKAQGQSGAKVTEIKDEYVNDSAISILLEVGATFEFTSEELRALDEAFRSAGFNIKKDKELAKHNFVAVKRSDFCATFIFCTRGLHPNKRKGIMEVFVAYTGYKDFGKIDEAPFGRQDWWSFDCITDYRKFLASEWPGTMLAQYNNLGNPNRMWVGSSLREKFLTVDFMDPQSSFTLIGGKSRSGKTCLSHAMIIQAICGGVLPTYLDWKPEGSELYKQSGFYVVQKDPTAWLPEGRAQGAHLLNILDALAWLRSISVIMSKREIESKRDFDRNKLATPDDPSVLYIFDEIAAFMDSLGSIRPTKKEKDMDAYEKACKEVADLAETVFKDLNASLAACATYGIRFMGITQDIKISDSIWTNQAWGGAGRTFRQRMQNIFWGRGTVNGSDCPINDDPQQKQYVNMGKGRFATTVEGEPVVFRALRIDNTPDPSCPELNASAVLQSCMQALGRQLPENRYSFFEGIMQQVKALPEFTKIYNAIAELNGQKEGEESSSYIIDGWGNGVSVEVGKQGRASTKAADIGVIGGIPYKQPVTDALSAATAGLQGKVVGRDAQLEAERLAREALENSIEVETDEGISTDSMEEVTDSYLLKAVEQGELDAKEALKILVEKRMRQSTSMTGNDGRRFVVDTTQTQSFSKLTKDNCIDCRNVSPGPLSMIEKLMLDTPAGAQRYIDKLWNAILEGVVSKGYKKANITRVSIYGGQMYVNGKIVNLNGVIGGYENIRLRDIVSFRTLFRKFFMIRELRLDMDMLRVAIAELGDSPIEKLFRLGQKLEIVYIQKENGEVVSFDRTSVMSSKAKEISSSGHAANELDMYCMAKSKNKWSDNRTGDNLWALRMAKSGLYTAGKMFMDRNKPSVGRAAIIAGASLMVGTVGAVVWGVSRFIGGVIGLSSALTGTNRYQ